MNTSRVAIAVELTSSFSADAVFTRYNKVDRFHTERFILEVGTEYPCIVGHNLHPCTLIEKLDEDFNHGEKTELFIIILFIPIILIQLSDRSVIHHLIILSWS